VITIQVRLFARARDLAGVDRVSVAVPSGATVGDLRRTMATELPKLAGLLARSAFAVNNEFADDALALAARAEVALLPPVSGG
jgi:molybdopterin converting factor subunit 1